jgi:hypothetical protein
LWYFPVLMYSACMFSTPDMMAAFRQMLGDGAS